MAEDGQMKQKHSLSYTYNIRVHFIMGLIIAAQQNILRLGVGGGGWDSMGNTIHGVMAGKSPNILTVSSPFFVTNPNLINQRG